ncbi:MULTISPECIES: flavin reductase [unclassified Butyrivibrio]|uniref:flavin reductase n=1 Tax=unclassified Butyrivibrio TaxID=2639466 RepID=UPI0004795776|nr:MULTISPECIES: flavin reductase [unclassified Butyrivibrio]
MHAFQPVNPEDIEEGAYSFVGQKIIITCKNGEKINAVSAPWGGVGYVWNKRVTFIFVRANRYTRECIDKSGEYSISFVDQEAYRGVLKYLGMVSGRDEDKIAGSRLNVNSYEGIPFIDEANEVIPCKVLYAHPFDESSFIDKSIIRDLHLDNDRYIMYVGEVQTILLK